MSLLTNPLLAVGTVLFAKLVALTAYVGPANFKLAATGAGLGALSTEGVTTIIVIWLVLQVVNPRK